MRKLQILLLCLITLFVVAGCPKEEDNGVVNLLSDKQSQSKALNQEEETNVETAANDQGENNSILQGEFGFSNAKSQLTNSQDVEESKKQVEDEQIQNTRHVPTAQQRLVYTKLSSWNNSKDYYEIAFNEVLAESLTDKDFAKHIEFSPSIAGEFKKIEDKILRFYPSERFAGNTSYTVKINQASLLNGDYAKLSLSFYNASPVLKLGQVALRTVENGEESYLEFIINHYRGRYSDRDYQEGIVVKVASRKIKIANLDYANTGEMIIQTAPFKAFDRNNFSITTDPNIFIVSSKRDLYYANSIGEMRKFLLNQVSTVTDAHGKARIELTFSKNLDTEQSLLGLISVKGDSDLDISISKFMNKAIITSDFSLNKEYTVQVMSGIKAADGSALNTSKTEQIKTFNRKRELEFADKGIFLSTMNKNSINIKVVNYAEVNYQLWAVQVENIAEMMHNINISDFSNISQSNYYRNNNLHWYGEEIKSGTIKTEVATDQDCFLKLDLGEVVKADPSKIYILNLNGEIDRKSTLNIPRDYNYYYSSKASKMLLITDLAVTAKSFKEKVIVNVVDVINASPIKRAEVQLRGYNNTLLASGRTNSAGQLTLDNLTRPLNFGQFFVIAEKKRAIGFLSSDAMYLDNTKFKVDRDYSQTEYKLEAWLDRTEYRPGETVNLTIMMRDHDNKLIKDNIPLLATIYDPQNSKVTSEKITGYKDGFATYKFPTQTDTNTGNWGIEIEFGSLKKYIPFSIETFVPERINVKIKADKDKYSFSDEYIDLVLENSYLFGAPLVGANCQINTVFNHNYSFAQEKFSEYSFIDEFAGIDYSMFKQEQDLLSPADGIVATSIKLLGNTETKHPYFANINAKITEEGGRPIERSLLLAVSPFEEYIGLGNNSYLKDKNGTFQVPVVVVDDSGNNLKKGSKVEYVIYGKRGSWWWDYDNNYRASFKKSESSSVIAQGTVTIGQDKYITFTPQSSDFNLFIVEAKLEGNSDYEINHKYFNSYWGDNSEITEDSSLELKTDKAEYEIGETVRVSIPASQGSKIYLTVVQKDQAISQELINVEKSGDYIYELETKASMTPNIYIDVRVIQGQKNKDNDLPLRLYGIIPVRIIDKSTRLDIKLDIPEKISSNSTLKGKIDVGVKKKTQYIVSIVDQGLINRTNYSMPNPWNLFYSSQGYYAQDYDNFSFFINAQNQEIFRTIMIGGGMFLESMAKYDAGRTGSAREEMNKLQETGVQRFKPVSYFLGVLETDEDGIGEFQVDVADYIGALTVTVLAANDQALGGKVKYTIVKDDIIALPTLPRVLSPKDEIEIPVTVVVDPLITSSVEVELVSNDLIEITSANKQVIPVNTPSSLLIFSAKVGENIGKADFTFNIKSKEFSSQKKIEVGVRLPSAYQTDSQMLNFVGNNIEYQVPELGFGNSSQTYLSFTQGFDFDAEQHLRYTVRYPYGGAVMNTASIFTQLLLSDFIKDVNLKNEIDANINSYFQQIVKYNKQGLWEWPGNWDSWNSRSNLNAYALHVCLIAKDKGYNINDFVYSEILNFLKKRTNNDNYIKFSDAYKLYVLALAGSPDLAKLNYYNEQQKIKVRANAVTMLEMAYKESGFDVNDLTKDLNADVEILMNLEGQDYLDPSDEVAKALELYSNIVYNNKDEVQKAKNRASALALAKKMQTTNYWNFYDKSWNLFTLNAYVKTLGKDYQNPKTAELEVTLAGKTQVIKVDDSYAIDLSAYKNQILKIKAISQNANDALVTVNNVYVPKNEDIKSVAQNLNVDVIYTDLNNNLLDVTSLEQGQSFYAEIRTTPDFTGMEFATIFILPSAWEFSSEEVQVNHYNRNNLTEAPLYTDVRDDRVIIYGKNSNKNPISYKCKINVVTKGKFIMPATSSEDIYHPENQAIIKGKIIEVK